MKRICNILTSMLFLTVTSSVFYTNYCIAEKINVVIYADDSYVPYSYQNKNGNPKGIYTAILLEAFKKMKGYNVKIKMVPWNRAMMSLENRTVLAAYPPYYRPKERPFIGTYSVPLVEETIVVYTRKDVLTHLRPNWPEDWYGLHVGLFLGTIDIAGKKFAAAVKANKIKMSESKSSHSNLLKIAFNRIDAYVNDRASILYTLEGMKRKGEWLDDYPKMAEGAIVSTENGYLAFTKDDPKYPYKTDFIKQFNAAILELKKKGVIKQIVADVIARRRF